jgi:hypothetical protein
MDVRFGNYMIYHEVVYYLRALYPAALADPVNPML